MAMIRLMVVDSNSLINAVVVGIVAKLYPGISFTSPRCLKVVASMMDDDNMISHSSLL